MPPKAHAKSAHSPAAKSSQHKQAKAAGNTQGGAANVEGGEEDAAAQQQVNMNIPDGDEEATRAIFDNIRDGKIMNIPRLSDRLATKIEVLFDDFGNNPVLAACLCPVGLSALEIVKFLVFCFTNRHWFWHAANFGTISLLTFVDWIHQTVRIDQFHHKIHDLKTY